MALWRVLYLYKHPPNNSLNLGKKTNSTPSGQGRLPTLHTNQRKQATPAPFKVQLFILRCEIKSGIHEPRIGNAVHAGDAGECDTPAKVWLNNEMCHFVPQSPTATGTSLDSSRLKVGACERRCTSGRKILAHEPAETVLDGEPTETGFAGYCSSFFTKLRRRLCWMWSKLFQQFKIA